jgi:hypothetical protein
MGPAPEELADLPAHPDVTLSVRTGTEHWRAGEITLRARGDGDAVVHNRSRGEDRAFNGRLDPAAVADLGRQVALVGSAPAAADRTPGDEPVLIAVERDGESLLQLDRWHGDRYGDAALDAVLTQADRLVAQITDGELPFGRG